MGEKQAAKGLSREEKVLRATLAMLNLPVRGSYRASEVCRILGIGEATFWRMIKAYERDENGRLVRPESLESFVVSSHRRVTYVELVAFMHRNNGWQREALQKAQAEAGGSRG